MSKEKVLVVVDMQRDFIDGALGTPEAEAILPAVCEKIRDFDGTVLFTKDTHEEDYLGTQEGRFLPVRHCIRGTAGWDFPEEIAALAKARGAEVFEKPTFGSERLAEALRGLEAAGGIEEIEFVGLCTDICVVSNALLAKAALPEVPVSVDAACCAGVTPAKHEAALETMRSCQVIVRNA